MSWQIQAADDIDADGPGSASTGFVAGGPIASDNFNRANGSIGSNWTTVFDFGSMAISSNQVVSSDTAAAFWVGAGSFANDQYSQITIVTWASGRVLAAGVRMAGSSFGTCKGYFLGTNANAPTDRIKLFMMNADSTFSDLVNDLSAPNLANGDVLKLVVAGNALTGYRNDVAIPQISGITDSTIATGKPGFLVGHTVDDWSAT